MNENDFIYPVRSCFHDYGTKECVLIAIYKDTIEIKRYTAEHITEIEIQGHCAFISVDYLSFVYIASGLSDDDLKNIITFAKENDIVWFVVEEKEGD